MERREILPPCGPPSKKASVAWRVTVICTIGAALLAVMVAAQGASAQDDPDPSAGWFQRCSLATTGYFDPIVHPKEPPPVGHRHLFVGATAISPTSTTEDLQAGGSTCGFQENIGAATIFTDDVIGGNYSSYWAPDLKVRNGNWASVKQVNAYYKKGASSVDRQKIERFPEGLMMVIRDRNDSKTNVKWYCAGTVTGSNGIYRERPYDCDPGSDKKYVTTHITFPQCGTGATDSTNHISHMIYAGDNGCPNTHPHVFPRLIVTVKYDTSLGANSKLATDVDEPPDHADPGTGFHADYFEAWKTDAAFKDQTKGTGDTLQFFVDHCIKAGINCRDGDMLPQ